MKAGNEAEIRRRGVKRRRCKAAAENDFRRRRSRSVEEEDPAVLAESAEMDVPVAEP